MVLYMWCESKKGFNWKYILIGKYEYMINFLYVYIGVFFFVCDKKYNYKFILNILYVYIGVFFICDKNIYFVIKIKKNDFVNLFKV